MTLTFEHDPDKVKENHRTTYLDIQDHFAHTHSASQSLYSATQVVCKNLDVGNHRRGPTVSEKVLVWFALINGLFRPPLTEMF